MVIHVDSISRIRIVQQAADQSPCTGAEGVIITREDWRFCGHDLLTAGYLHT